MSWSHAVGEPAPGGWYIGFDCGHAGDAPEPDSELATLERDTILFEGAHVWTLTDVAAETERLAKQVASAQQAWQVTRSDAR